MSQHTRIGRAERALDAVPDVYTRNEEGITDLLSDLLHLAAYIGIDVDELSARAQRNYAGECLEHEDSDAISLDAIARLLDGRRPRPSDRGLIASHVRASGRQIRDAGEVQSAYVVEVLRRVDGLYLFTDSGASQRFARAVEATGGEVAQSEEPLNDGEIALQHLIAAELCGEG